MHIQVNEHILLKTWEEIEADQLFSLVDSNRDILSPWLPWVPYVQKVSDSLHFIKTSGSDPTQEKGLEMGIWYQSKLAGCIGLHEVSFQHKKTSVGYWLGKEFFGKGIMTLSVKSLATYCFTELGLNRFELRAATENLNSQAVAKRLGFIKEGVLREAELVEGRFLDDIVFSVLKKEWKQ